MMKKRKLRDLFPGCTCDTQKCVFHHYQDMTDLPDADLDDVRRLNTFVCKLEGEDCFRLYALGSYFKEKE